MAQASGINRKQDVSSGILTDDDIAQAAGSKMLVSEHFSKSQLDGCAYEFRTGRIGYHYDYVQKKTLQYEADEHVILPFETVTITSFEQVNLDKKHFLWITAKGSLFSLGLSAVCTAADPGFRGHLGITLTNMSARPVVIRNSTGFVKGVFFRLTKEVTKHYVGQHGDATMSWPYPSQYHTEPEDFTSLSAPCWKFIPPPVRATLIRLSRASTYLKWITFAFVIVTLLNLTSPILKHYFSQGTYTLLERYISLVGSFASIAGLLLAVTLLHPGSRDV